MVDQKKQKVLLKACKAGNRKAQFQLYHAYKVQLFGVCMRYAKNRTEAEDMLQEGFYQIFKDLKQYKGKVPLSAWMRKVCVNASLMHIRKYKKVLYSELDGQFENKTQFVSTDLMSQDRSAAIISMIRQLPEAQQVVFNLRAMEGFSFKEISAKLDCNEATLRSHYLRARTKLQSLLKTELK